MIQLLRKRTTLATLALSLSTMAVACDVSVGDPIDDDGFGGSDGGDGDNMGGAMGDGDTSSGGTTGGDGDGSGGSAMGGDTSSGGSDSGSGGSVGVDEFAHSTPAGLTFEFTFDDANPDDPAQIWTFGDDAGDVGMATFDNVEFSYTYDKIGPNESEVVFVVGGDDIYFLTWTSDSGGTFENCFDDFMCDDPGTGTFTAELL